MDIFAPTKIGDRVYLREDSPYFDNNISGMCNPGSISIFGTVVEIDDELEQFFVQWDESVCHPPCDSGHNNVNNYDQHDLVYIGED